MLLLGEDGVGELGDADLLRVGLLLHEGQDLRASQVFWDFFDQVLLEHQLAIAFLGSLFLIALLALLTLLLLLLLVFLLLLLFFLLLLFLLLLLLFLLLLLLFLLLLFLLLVLVLLGRLGFLGGLLLVAGSWLDGLVGLDRLVEIGLNGPLVSLLERRRLRVLEVGRLAQIARLLLVEVTSLLIEVTWLLLIEVALLLVEVTSLLLLIEVAWLLLIVVSLLLVIARLAVSSLLIVAALLVDVVAVVDLFPIMRTLLVGISLRRTQRCLHRRVLLGSVPTIVNWWILLILLKLTLLGRWLIALPLVLLALELRPGRLRLRGRRHIWLVGLVGWGEVLRIAEDAGVGVARAGWLLLLLNLPLIVGLLLVLERARILPLLALRTECIFGLWL